MPDTVHVKNGRTESPPVSKKKLRGGARRKAKGIALSDAEMRVVYAYCKATGNQYWTVALRNVGVASMAEKLEAMGYDVRAIRTDTTIEEEWHAMNDEHLLRKNNAAGEDNDAHEDNAAHEDDAHEDDAHEDDAHEDNAADENGEAGEENAAHEDDAARGNGMTDKNSAMDEGQAREGTALRESTALREGSEG